MRLIGSSYSYFTLVNSAAFKHIHGGPPFVNAGYVVLKIFHIFTLTPNPFQTL